MKFTRSSLALGTAISLALSLTSCEQTLKLRAEVTELDAKVAALQEEQRTLDSQLQAIRPSLPPAGTIGEAARLLHSKASGEITILQANLKTAAAGLKETEAAVAALKEEIASQRPKAN